VAQRQIEYNAAQKLESRGFNSRIGLSEALANLEAAKAALRAAEIDLEKTGIVAPFAGTIADQNVEVGDYLDIGHALFTLVTLDPLEVTGYVSERHVRDLSAGGPARVDFEENGSAEGTLSYIAPAADLDTRTFRITVSLPNAERALRGGLTAQIRLPVAEKKAHKISPSILSLNDKGQIGVKLVDERDTVRFVPVTVLADRPDAMWVGGLPEQARVITVGQDFVAEGERVHPVPAEGPGLL
jgi:multidrug efflux system membrane fusion protein